MDKPFVRLAEDTRVRTHKTLRLPDDLLRGKNMLPLRDGHIRHRVGNQPGKVLYAIFNENDDTYWVQHVTGTGHTTTAPYHYRELELDVVVGSVDVDLLAGWSIGKAIEQILRGDKGTHTRFNGVPLVVGEGSTFEKLLQEYGELVRVLHEDGEGSRPLTVVELDAFLRRHMPQAWVAPGGPGGPTTTTCPRRLCDGSGFRHELPGGPACECQPPRQQPANPAPDWISRPELLPPGVQTYTLLIWEEMPERTTLVLIQNVWLKDEDFEVFRVANGYYMNGTVTNTEQRTAIQKLTEALAASPEHLSEEARARPTRWNMRFKGCVVATTMQGDRSPGIEGKIITQVYRTGWFL